MVNLWIPPVGDLFSLARQAAFYILQVANLQPWLRVIMVRSQSDMLTVKGKS